MMMMMVMMLTISPVVQDVSTSPEGLHYPKKSPGLGQSPADLDKLKSEGGLTGPSLYSDMSYSKLSGDMVGVGVGYGGPDYSRLLGAGLGGGGVPGVPGQADYSKLLTGGSQGLYHSFMHNSYMTSQLNMSPHQPGLPNLPSSY